MQEQAGQARTQDQSLLMLDHCQSSDLMRIVQFILLLQPLQNFYPQTCVQAGFRMQNNSNLTTVRISSSILLSKEGTMQEQAGQARTQDQSLLMVDHCQSSDLMRIVQFILVLQPLQNFYPQTCVQAGSRMQNNSNLTTVRISSSILLSKEGTMQEQAGQARTQDQSLLMVDHCQSSDLMRIVQFILVLQPLQNFYPQTCVQAGSRMQNNSNLTTVRISSSVLLSKEGSMQE